MDSARLTYLFHRYINRTCTEAERIEFLEMVNEPDYEVQVKDLMKGLWSKADGTERMSFARTERILVDILGDEEKEMVKHSSAFSRWGKAVALASCILVGIAGVGYYIVSPQTRSESIAELPQKVETHQIVKLPDGSVVVLNAGSSLEFPETFKGKKNREVTLRGEGYFDIKHDASAPFIVYTGKLRTTVLGTAFNIKAYPNDNDITVTVTRGKVKVSDDQKVIGIITPDQQIKFNKYQEASQQQRVDSKEVVSWSDRDIFFDDATLADVAKQLEQRFKVAIVLDNDTIKDCRFTATFVSGEDLNQILTVICEFNGSHFNRDATGVIHISGGAGC
ncbi:FecR family protein [Ohtaekwangia kribbensis]|jgi:transmembrane sensor|uniref:FecR family protein n=1 Tax=Ohtaekwangia kribbensis TaxID=688913 RepID=A0ABW3KC21_9BACT